MADRLSRCNFVDQSECTEFFAEVYKDSFVVSAIGLCYNDLSCNNIHTPHALYHKQLILIMHLSHMVLPLLLYQNHQG